MRVNIQIKSKPLEVPDFFHSEDGSISHLPLHMLTKQQIDELVDEFRITIQAKADEQRKSLNVRV